MHSLIPKTLAKLNLQITIAPNYFNCYIVIFLQIYFYGYLKDIKVIFSSEMFD